jgi:predicted ABC-type ATPase
MPVLYIITGSNGAGKSSIGADYLPFQLRNNCSIFDGDKFFMQKKKELWKSGIRAHKEAKKLAFEFVSDTFDDLVENALATNTNFVYEGHFTNEATWDIPKRFKANNYSIHLIFFGLADTSLPQLRVIGRTEEGGHYVDPLTIADNFYGNLEKLNEHFKMFDTLLL